MLSESVTRKGKKNGPDASPLKRCVHRDRPPRNRVLGTTPRQQRAGSLRAAGRIAPRSGPARSTPAGSLRVALGAAELGSGGAGPLA